MGSETFFDNILSALPDMPQHQFVWNLKYERNDAHSKRDCAVQVRARLEDVYNALASESQHQEGISTPADITNSEEQPLVA